MTQVKRLGYLILQIKLTAVNRRHHTGHVIFVKALYEDRKGLAGRQCVISQCVVNRKDAIIGQLDDHCLVEEASVKFKKNVFFDYMHPNMTNQEYLWRVMSDDELRQLRNTTDSAIIHPLDIERPSYSRQIIPAIPSQSLAVWTYLCRNYAPPSISIAVYNALALVHQVMDRRLFHLHREICQHVQRLNLKLDPTNAEQSLYIISGYRHGSDADSIIGQQVMSSHRVLGSFADRYVLYSKFPHLSWMQRCQINCAIRDDSMPDLAPFINELLIYDLFTPQMILTKVRLVFCGPIKMSTLYFLSQRRKIDYVEPLLQFMNYYVDDDVHASEGIWLSLFSSTARRLIDIRRRINTGQALGDGDYQLFHQHIVSGCGMTRQLFQYFSAHNVFPGAWKQPQMINFRYPHSSEMNSRIICGNGHGSDAVGIMRIYHLLLMISDGYFDCTNRALCLIRRFDMVFIRKITLLLVGSPAITERAIDGLYRQFLARYGALAFI